MRRLTYTMAMAALCLAGGDAYAQQRNCASHEHLLQQQNQYPEMQQERQRLEDFTQQYVRDFETTKSKTTAAIYTIPVVVHVLYNNSTQNISDAQILSQISVLNADFQKLNADASLVPSAFSGLAADCQIQFCMAQRDPSGNATTGIIRKSTTKSSFNADTDDAKSNSTGGSSAWPATQYLNLWVVPSITSGGQGGILGYAQFPGGPASTDGVVIGYQYFGTMGTASAPFNKGRTGTHEVGHWANLYHIWGDDGNACNGSDLVGDTPNQGSENYGCPSFPHVSCSNGANGDMFMNYMDYTDDACMYMFSTGQKARMHAVFAAGGSRSAITTSLGCQAPTGGGTCAVPASLNATSITTSSAAISWGAVSGATSYSLQWKLASASTWNTVSSITGTSYGLSGLSAATTYNYRVATACSGSSSAYSSSGSFTTLSVPTCSDNYETNNTISTAITIPVNTTVVARIGTSTDKDYYKFTNTSANPKIKVTLTNLPFDYDLKLYNPSGTLLGTSQNGGTTSETLVYNTTTVGTYYVYVYGYNGAYSASSCYNVNAQIGAANFREELSQPNDKLTEGAHSLNFYPNPAKTEVFFEYFGVEGQDAEIVVYDQAGRLVQQTPLHLDEGVNQPKFDVSTLQSGLYFVRLVTAQGSMASKLMIQR